MNVRVLFLPLLFALNLPAQTIWHVQKSSAAPAPDGQSWATAFPDLRQALVLAQPNDEIWLAAGTYFPTTDADRLKTFVLPAGVALYGGFAGNETARDGRNYADNQSILSGDIGVPGDSTDNSFGVLYVRRPTAQTRVDGVIIEEGNAVNPDIVVYAHRRTRSGGGICVDCENGQGFLTVANCTLRRNRANYQGGAMTMIGRGNGSWASAWLENCLFERNTSKNFGGAISVENYGMSPQPFVVRKCSFRQNFTNVEGGAMRLTPATNIVFEDCTFEENRLVGGLGGALAFNIQDFDKSISLENCRFVKNGSLVSNVEGGAIGILQYNPTGKTQFVATNCLFSQQTTHSTGGMNLSFHGIGQINSTLSNCIFDQPRNTSTNLTHSTAPFVLGCLDGLDTARFNNCLFYQTPFHEFEFDSKVEVFLTNCIRFKTSYYHQLVFTSLNAPPIKNIHLDHCLFNALGTCKK